VAFCIENANRGFPLAPRRVKLHAERILIARLGHKFPIGGLGKEWTTRFLSRHAHELGHYWSRAIDSARGRAVNEVTREEYFRLLKEVREEYDIPDELVYGADESGLQTGIGQKEYVVGGKGKHVQHQDRSGNRENITALPTICADGTCLAPLVIFKGNAFQIKWLQENPLNARSVTPPSHFS